MYRFKTEYDKDMHIHLLGKEVFWAREKSDKHTNPELIWKCAQEVIRLDRKTEEYVYCFCYNAAGHLLGYYEVSHGTVMQSLVTPRELFQKALYVGAVSLVLVHNHPSQDVTPSHYDRELTQQLAICGRLIGVILYDHIIVSQKTYYSFLENDRAVLEVAV